MENNKTKTSCLFCKCEEFSESHLPKTKYNSTIFSYLKCSKCNLIYLNPFPSSEDYLKMYPPTYQMGVLGDVILDGQKLPGLRFSYSKQYKLIRTHTQGSSILDYGCGHCNFLINAKLNGFKCDGAEFNPDHLKILNEKISDSKFYSINEFLHNSTSTYDVIRLSNVLEHLEDPMSIILSLKEKLSDQGVILIEGPIETNFSLAYLSRLIYFKLSKFVRPRRLVNHSPTHIFFSNLKNQRAFFKAAGLMELCFEVKDNEWPYPEFFKEVKGFGLFLKYLIGKFSKYVSFLFPNWGNTFIYVGKVAK